MIPSTVIDWAVWANLDRHRHIELILLKGHLLLEVVLSECLSARSSLTEPQIKRLSFHEKLKRLVSSAEDKKPLEGALKLLQVLNRLRNKVAHEPFAEIEPELAIWSDQVLSVFVSRKHQRYTRRTKITQAMSTIARGLYESAHGASPGFPDTSNDMMCLGSGHAKDEKSVYRRVQERSGEACQAARRQRP